MTTFSAGPMQGSSLPATTYLPRGEGKAALATLSAAAFDVLARNSNRQGPIAQETSHNATTARELDTRSVAAARFIALYLLQWSRVQR